MQGEKLNFFDFINDFLNLPGPPWLVTLGYIARSVSHLLHALEAFRAWGIDFVSISEQVDTSTPTGKMVFTVLGAVAELERSLIAERVRMGLQNARKKGKRLGRPPIRELTAADLEKVRADRATGKFSLRKLAAKYGTSVWAMQQATTGQNGVYENLMVSYAG